MAAALAAAAAAAAMPTATVRLRYKHSSALQSKAFFVTTFRFTTDDGDGRCRAQLLCSRCRCRFDEFTPLEYRAGRVGYKGRNAWKRSGLYDDHYGNESARPYKQDGQRLDWVYTRAMTDYSLPCSCIV